MPIYEYRCRKCERAFDVLVRNADDEREARCPDCQGRQVERVLSVFAARSAKRDLIEFLALFIDAENADMPGVMMPAGVDAT